MFYLEIVLLILFAVLLVVGYRKNNRNIMLGAVLCLVVATALPSFIAGMQGAAEEGVRDGRASWEESDS